MTRLEGPGSRLPARRPLRIASAELVHTWQPTAADYPLVIESRLADIDLVEWAGANRDFITERLVRHGALLFRGFRLPDLAAFAAFVRATSREPLPYLERSSPRETLAPNVYTSTSHPAEHEIFLHNEQSYNLNFPAKIYFYCAQPAAQGGATPIAATRRVLAELPEELVARFAASGYRYVRNFGSGLGLSWQTAFQTSDRTELARYAADNGIELHWIGPERLRTSQLRSCLLRHPRTGERLWFNHLTFFHPSTLAPALQAELRAALCDDELSHNTVHADGSPVAPEIMAALRSAYVRAKVSVPWQRHDCLMLDNMLMAHGRESYVGQRAVVTALSEPCSWAELGTEDAP